ncbi:MAG: phosphoribosylanthranilate isomerase [Chloroflexi bacterium]|nr:phosphoribosylanthranilate isomerase [Chloroflexota bacterium]
MGRERHAGRRVSGNRGRRSRQDEGASLLRVKICGIMEAQQAVWAVEAGADYVGLVLAPSRRRIATEKAREIATRLDAEGLRDRVGLVGVFVNESPARINETARACGLDYVQLSGDESWDFCRQIELPLIKAVKLAANYSASELVAGLEREWTKLETSKLAILVEPLVDGFHGGAGKQLDWESLGELSGTLPVILAGGLNPDSVETACRLVKPWGVDVSSGVETNGVKDREKIKAFVAAARREE